jgi:hypothetical protein
MIKRIEGTQEGSLERENPLYLYLVISHLKDPSRPPKSNSGKIISD